MQHNSNTPSLRFPEFKQQWVSKKLGELLEFKNGINATKEQYGSGYKFINVLDILNNDFITHDKIIGSVNVDKAMVNKFPVAYGDILFQRSSETREEVGTASVYLDKEHIATFGGFVIRGKKIGDYDPVFFNKLLKTDTSREQITSKSGGSTRYNVGQEILASVELSFPTLPEQQKIATFLTAVDKKIQTLKAKKRLLEQYKKGVMQQLFSQQLRFKKEDGEAFEEWEARRLGECLDYIQPTKYLVESTEYDNKYETPVLTAGKTFILGYTNEINGIFKEHLPVIIFDDFTTATQFVNFSFKAKSSAMKILIAKKNIDIKFMFEAMQIMKYEIGGHERHWISKFANIDIPIPTLPEQTKIANFLSTLDAKINAVAGEVSAMEVWKKGLLQGLFV
jgi:type I restriction enzyme, S subunit